VFTSSDRRRKNRARRIIAGKIIECANRGETSLSRLTEAGYAAAMQLSASAQSVRKKEAANKETPRRMRWALDRQARDQRLAD